MQRYQCGSPEGFIAPMQCDSQATEPVSSVDNYSDIAVLCWALDLPGGQLICMLSVLSMLRRLLQNCLAG